jgi:hypothetical protein
VSLPQTPKGSLSELSASLAGGVGVEVVLGRVRGSHEAEGHWALLTGVNEAARAVYVNDPMGDRPSYPFEALSHVIRYKVVPIGRDYPLFKQCDVSRAGAGRGGRGGGTSGASRL